MSLRKQYKTDDKLEREGVEYETGGVVFHLARSGGSNTRYNKTMDRLCKPYRRQIQSKTMDDEVATRIAHKAFAVAVVLGWKGVTHDDLGDEGNMEPAPFTSENCIKLFEELPELFLELQQVSQERAVFMEDIMEEDAGN